MDIRYLEAIVFYLVVLGLFFALMRKLPEKFWIRFGAVMFPLMLAAHLIYNITSFPYINQKNKWNTRRLPSNELIDLLNNGVALSRVSWIYALIEDSYLGRTLFVPESLFASLDLSAARLKSQGGLADVIPVEFNYELTERDVDLILKMEYHDMDTMEGDIYYFITEEKHPGTPLLLLKYENKLFFIPEDLLKDVEESL